MSEHTAAEPCAVCFTTPLKWARFGSCVHSICVACLEKLPKSDWEKGRKCPLCRQQFAWTFQMLCGARVPVFEPRTTLRFIAEEFETFCIDQETEFYVELLRFVRDNTRGTPCVSAVSLWLSSLQALSTRSPVEFCYHLDLFGRVVQGRGGHVAGVGLFVRKALDTFKEAPLAAQRVLEFTMCCSEQLFPEDGLFEAMLAAVEFMAFSWENDSITKAALICLCDCKWHTKDTVGSALQTPETVKRVHGLFTAVCTREFHNSHVFLRYLQAAPGECWTPELVSSIVSVFTGYLRPTLALHVLGNVLGILIKITAVMNPTREFVGIVSATLSIFQWTCVPESTMVQFARFVRTLLKNLRDGLVAELPMAELCDMFVRRAESVKAFKAGLKCVRDCVVASVVKLEHKDLKTCVENVLGFVRRASTRYISSDCVWRSALKVLVVCKEACASVLEPELELVFSVIHKGLTGFLPDQRLVALTASRLISDLVDTTTVVPESAFPAITRLVTVCFSPDGINAIGIWNLLGVLAARFGSAQHDAVVDLFAHLWQKTRDHTRAQKSSISAKYVLPVLLGLTKYPDNELRVTLILEELHQALHFDFDDVDQCRLYVQLVQWEQARFRADEGCAGWMDQGFRANTLTEIMLMTDCFTVDAVRLLVSVLSISTSGVDLGLVRRVLDNIEFTRVLFKDACVVPAEAPTNSALKCVRNLVVACGNHWCLKYRLYSVVTTLILSMEFQTTQTHLCLHVLEAFVEREEFAEECKSALDAWELRQILRAYDPEAPVFGKLAWTKVVHWCVHNTQLNHKTKQRVADVLWSKCSEVNFTVLMECMRAIGAGPVVAFEPPRAEDEDDTPEPGSKRVRSE